MTLHVLTDAVTWHEKDVIYWFTGFGLEYNNILLDSEYVSYEVEDSSDAKNEAWYVALGYRLGDYVITLHKEEQTQEIDYSGIRNTESQVLLLTGIRAIDAFAQAEFDGVGITLRYDFHPNAAFKLDYFDGEHTRPDIGDYTIVSAGIDVVF